MKRRSGRAAGWLWWVVAAGAAWLAFGFWVVPDWIRGAYQGEGPAWLQREIAERAPRPLTDYLELWRRSVWALGALWVAMGLASWAMTQRGFQRWWDRKLGAAPALAPRQDLGPRRLRRVEGLILVLILGQAAAIASWLEVWPFSPYRMFAVTRRAGGDTLIKYRLAGIPAVVPAVGPTAEIRVPPRMIRPLLHPGFQRTAARARRAPDAERATRDLVTALLALYESGRLQGRHDGPALRALRLYEYVWHGLDSEARDAERPHRRILLASTEGSG